MINLLIGAPGGGKSYEATAYHVLPALAAGRKVITNLPLVIDLIEAAFPQAKELLVVRKESKAKGKLPFAVLDDWLDDWRHPETSVGPLIIVDECHQVIPRSGTDQAIVEHAALHRHTGADWLLMTQDHGKINKDIKALVQLSYVVRKNVALGKTKSYTRSVYDGLKTSGTGNRVNQTERTYNPAFFKFYKSHTLSQSAVLEEGAKDVTPTYKKFIWGGIAICLLFPAILGGKAAWDYYHPKPKPEFKKYSDTARQAQAHRTGAPAPSARRSTGAGAPTPEASGAAGAPLETLDIRLLGQIGNTKRAVWWFAVERAGQQQFTMTGPELYKAGYRITEVADCVVQVEHPAVPSPFFVRCGSSFQSVNSLRSATETAMPSSINGAATTAAAATG